MAKINLNDKYKILFSSDSRYYILTGGRGSSKSFSVTAFLSLLMLEKGHKILFTRYTMTSARLSIIPEFIEKLELYGITEFFELTKDSIKNKLNGNEIIFKGIQTSSGNQTAALKSLEGITTWVLDEAEELNDEETFDKINLSVRQKGVQNRIILILNPTTKQHWIYNKFFIENGVDEGFNGTKGNTTYIHTTYLDNIKHLNEDFIKDVELMKVRRPEKYKHQILGGWLEKAEGVIYNNWKFEKLPNNLDFSFGLDFGFSIDPTALIGVSIDTNKKIIYAKEFLYKSQLTTTPIIDYLRLYASNKLIVADSAEQRLISEIRAANLKIQGVKKGAGSVLEGIFLLQDYDLIIDEESINLAKELNNYVWIENRVKPIDAHNHLLDALRYITTYLLKNPNEGTYAIR